MTEKKYVEEVFNYLHSIPEIGCNEFKTSKFISGELKKFGYNVMEGFAVTGLVATLDSGVKGPVLAVRADMDALQFELDGEKVNIHACGHDANSSMVLATAREIAEKGINRGKIMFVFQPAEEILGGAKEIAKSGVLDEADEIIGIHLRPIQEAKLGEATPALCHGSSQMMKVKINGIAAHGARPHLGVNVIDASALAINAINAVKVDPRVPHSAKVTSINTGDSAYNIIPSSATLALDLRAQTNDVMEKLVEKIKEAINNSVKAIGADAEIEVSTGVPAAEYNEDTVNLAREAITEVLGGSLSPIVTPGGEDFHFYTKFLDIKSAYIGLGANLVPGLHSPEMEFDLKALEYGKEILKRIVLKRVG
ncbi:amidohydrolase [Maledivibacter halophilus]|uniref:Amidohydrolase n=1 Tax=Maledivibacter halophilus TaxID=36842 RepID=A0A1T5M5W7_9FIRM|nr:amidohydrolase [Maledivibacter halophilus]SKC83523.1 amidohydrolase [Maledivibacter halophilus]